MSAEKINYVNRDGLFRYDESTNTEIALFTHRSINNLTKNNTLSFFDFDCRRYKTGQVFIFVKEKKRKPVNHSVKNNNK